MANPDVIASVTATPVAVPVKVPTRMATRALTSREYVLVNVAASDGAEGIGYSYIGTVGARLVADLLMSVLGPLLIGRSPGASAELWPELYQELLLIGRRGAVLRALSAIDMALWDLRAKRAQMPLATLLGAHSERVSAYASGGYYRHGDPIRNVREELARYAQAGFKDFKIKVGGAALDVDIARVEAAREVIGSECRLALDANNAWRSVKEALQFAARVAAFNPWWIEEPFSPDEVGAHAELAARIDIPVATGEIHATRWEFRSILENRAADILQPDVGVVGGIGEWLLVASAARVFGVPVAPHWNANVHAHLVAATGGLAVEYFSPDEGVFNFEQLIDEPLTVRDGEIVLPQRPGLGFSFDPDAVRRYRIM